MTTYLLLFVELFKKRKKIERKRTKCKCSYASITSNKLTFSLNLTMARSFESYLINRTDAITRTISNHVVSYPTPLNFTYSYSFGSLVGLFFVLQLLTGIFLAMHYTAHTDEAFSSVVHIMMNVKNGYLMRYMHANGASMIFIFLYLHMGRGLYYRSFTFDRRYL